MVCRSSARCNRKVVAAFFAAANALLVWMIIDDYRNGSERYRRNVEEEHPGLDVNVSQFQLPNTAAITSLTPRSTLASINSTDPITNRQVIAEIFSPDAYFNVELKYLNRLAERAVEVNSKRCDDVTSASARQRSKDTGLPLCSCSPDTLGWCCSM